MEIRRCASRRPGAEWFELVPDDVQPEITRDESGRLLLRVVNVPSPRDPSGWYDTEVYLNQRDIERLRSHLFREAHPAEQGAAADRPRE